MTLPDRIGYDRMVAVAGRSNADLLRLWGIEGGTAEELGADFDRTRIINQIHWLPYRAGKKPSGVLIRSVQDNYVRPDLTVSEIAEVEAAISEGLVPIQSIEKALKAEDEFATSQYVQPETTHAPGCNDPTCEGCDLF